MAMAMVLTANTSFAAAKLKRVYLESNPSFELTKSGIETLLKSNKKDANALREVIRLGQEITIEDLRNIQYDGESNLIDKGGCKSVCAEVCVAGICGSVCGEVCED